jgi:hypothetical protein
MTREIAFLALAGVMLAPMPLALNEETSEPIPMVQAVTDDFCDQGLARDARELLFKPGYECEHERLDLLLAYGMPRASPAP